MIDFETIDTGTVDTSTMDSIGDMLMSLVKVDEPPHFSQPETVILNDASAYPTREAHGEITDIRVPAYRGNPTIVKADRITALFSDGLPPEHFTRHSRRCTSHRCHDLYGYAHLSGLAVIQVREGSWDEKRHHGGVSKTYYVIDSFGTKIEVPHNKLRAAARTQGDLVSP